MALDYGDKTVGVALSDERLIIAQPLETITRDRSDKLRRTYARIEEIIKEYDVTRIILGYPVTMDGDEGERVALTRLFKEGLERRTGLPVIFFDERLTTFAADEVLDEMDVAPKERKQYIDKIAAALILEAYLNKGDS